MNIQGPTPQHSVPTASLYYECLDLIEKLYSLPSFESYLFPGGIKHFLNSEETGLADPVRTLWECFRLGVPLCFVYNQTRPPTLLEVGKVQHGTYDNTCKKAVFNFIVACKEQLGIDESLGISDIFKDDTTGFVKMVRIVKRVVSLLESRKFLPLKRQLPFKVSRASNSSDLPMDNRSKVIRELLETERNYTASLEELQNYATEVQNLQLLSKDEMHILFANLSELLDFQRRFLIAMEQTLSLPMNEQRIGLLFSQHEDGFRVYEPFCASYKAASELILSESNKLQRVAHLIEPNHGLPSYLIKPVQRVCKYPLLLREIIKYTNEKEYPYMQELHDGLEVVKRITETVNEQKRLEENRELKKDLIERVIDFKGLNIEEFGELLLNDRFPMQSNGVEREYSLYLFERILLCCKEQPKKRKKKGKEEYTPLSLKGNIYITSIGGVQDISNVSMQQFGLQVYWRDGNEMETFALNCRNEEQAKLWHDRLERQIHSERDRRISLIDDKGLLRGFNNMNVNADDEQEEFNDVETGSPVVTSHPRRKSEANLSIDPSAASTNHNKGVSYPASPSVNRSKSITSSPPFSDESFSSKDSSQLRKSVPALPRGSSLVGSAEYFQQIPSHRLSTHRSGIDSPPPSSPRTLTVPPPPTHQPPPPPLTNSRIPPSNVFPSPPVSTPSSPRLQQRPSNIITRATTVPGADIYSVHSAGYTPTAHYDRHPHSPSLGPSDGLNSRFGNPAVTDGETRFLARKQRLQSISNASRSEPPSIPLPPPPVESEHVPMTSSRTVVTLPTSSMVKIRMHYGADSFILVAASKGCQYSELYAKIERKLRLSGVLRPEGRSFKMKYRNESGDYIHIATDTDVSMALESVGKDQHIDGEVNIFVQAC